MADITIEDGTNVTYVNNQIYVVFKTVALKVK